jgi:phosphocarrier protein HPr
VISQTIEVVNRLGLHARAAAKFVDCAAAFSSRIQVEKNRECVDGKSIMSVMMLAAGQGTILTLHIDGADETLALEALTTLIADRFGEPD